MSAHNKWQALSMKDRAFLIREAVRNGITDIDSIRDTWEHRFDGKSDQSVNINKSILDKERIVRNVPAREWGPDYNEGPKQGKGISSLLEAAQWYFDDRTQAGKFNENLAKEIIAKYEKDGRSRDELYDKYSVYDDHEYIDALHYLEHIAGLRKYLNLPYDQSLLMESDYLPTRLQGGSEKTYKFQSGDLHRYEDAVQDMLESGNRKRNYIDHTLNEFTAYRDRDDAGDFISIYDEWDYNPNIRGGNKRLNSIIDMATGGKPFVVYDRVYLDDYYNIPEEHRGNFFIDPVVVTPENNKK